MILTCCCGRIRSSSSGAQAGKKETSSAGRAVKHEIRPSLCVIRWDYIITIQLLNEADKPEEFDFRPSVYL
jgi:hypothetical protein